MKLLAGVPVATGTQAPDPGGVARHKGFRENDEFRPCRCGLCDELRSGENACLAIENTWRSLDDCNLRHANVSRIMGKRRREAPAIGSAWQGELTELQ
jgi:hypothetical protein